VILFFGLFITSCSPKLILINDEFPEAKAEDRVIGEVFTLRMQHYNIDSRKLPIRE